jgi:ankyrin repeat protein
MCPGHGTPLAVAAAAGRADVVRLLLRRGADPNAGSPDGFSPLMHAAQYDGSVRVAELLIVAGADVNARSHSGTRL